MRFVQTKRFSPVVHDGDLPWEEDYFHLPSGDITKEFLENGDYIIDEEWWIKQEKRCREGFTVKNAIEPGGDCFVDGVDVFWNHGTSSRYDQISGKTLAPNCAYIPIYDLMIENREVHITGRQYFYLNFWPIYGLAIGGRIKGIVKPRFLDVDFFFFRRVEMMIEQERDQSELKRRQGGFSEKVAGGVLGWNYTFVPASVNIIVAGEATDAEHTMENVIRGLDDLRNTQFYKNRPRGGDSKEVIKASNKSEVRTLTAKDKPQTVSRYSPYWVVYEEVGKWRSELILDVVSFVKPSIQAEGKKTGFQTFIGTGGDMEAGAADLEKIHRYPDSQNVLKFFNPDWEEPCSNADMFTGHFTPAYMYHIIDEDGNSLRQKSIEALEREASQLSWRDQYTFWSQKPIFASQAFLINTGGFFGKEIVQMLNARRAFILTHTDAQVEEIGRLEWIDTKNPYKGVKFIQDPEGWFHVFEHPDRDKDGNVYINLYKTTTDSYDQDESTTDSRGSWQCWKGFNRLKPDSTNRKYVARITERPKTEEGGKERFYEHTAMGCVYYGFAINLIEWSKILIIDWYVKHGFENLLKERPEFVTASMIKKSNATNRYGIDPVTKPYWLSMLKDELTLEFIDKMDDVYQIERLAKFRYDPTGKKYNCDTTITSALCVVLDKDEMEMEVFSKAEEKMVEQPIHYKTVNGRLVAI